MASIRHRLADRGAGSAIIKAIAWILCAAVLLLAHGPASAESRRRGKNRRSGARAPQTSPTSGKPDTPEPPPEEAGASKTSDSEDPTDRRARELYEQADRLYVQGKYEQAIQAFQESYVLSGRHLILYAIANSYERLGRYEDALATLRQYEPHAQPSEQKDLEERIRTLERRIEEQRARSTVGVDATSSGQGSHGARRRTGWIVAGSGAAVVATGLAFGLVAQNAKSDIGDLCQDTGSGTFCLPEAESAIDRNRRYALLADASLAVGAIAVAVGAVLVITSDEAPARGPVISFSPGVVEVGFVGRF